jgi:sugar phosphate isomerase/epimerase
MARLALSTWSLLLKMDYRQAFTFALEHGFAGVEFWSCPADFWPGRLRARELDAIRLQAEKHGIARAVHFWYDGNNLADLDEGHRRESLRQLREALRLCNRLGASPLVIHSGSLPAALPIHDRPEQHPALTRAALHARAGDCLRASLREAAEHAERAQVVLGLENLGHARHTLQRSHTDLAKWVDEVGSPWLGVTLDVGHAHLEGSVSEAIRILGPRIRHVHLDDNNGLRSIHGELGTGTIDWEELAPFLAGCDGLLSLEVSDPDDVEGAVLRSRDFLQTLLRRLVGGQVVDRGIPAAARDGERHAAVAA